MGLTVAVATAAELARRLHEQALASEHLDVGRMRPEDVRFWGNPNGGVSGEAWYSFPAVDPSDPDGDQHTRAYLRVVCDPDSYREMQEMVDRMREIPDEVWTTAL